MCADVFRLYRRENLLGSGTYGNVYRAVRYSDNKTVAIKEIKLDHDNEGVPATALREIIVLKALGAHPYIVSLVDVVHSEKSLSLVFDYYNTDLHQLISRLRKRQRTLSMEQIRTFTTQMLSALEFMHSKNIAHRDIKPSNLLIGGYPLPASSSSPTAATEDEDGELLSICIADFGLARPVDAPSRNNSSNIVSLWYRAPELLNGRTDYTCTIDVWSVGCVVVEMLNGVACFRTKEVAQQTNDGQLAEIDRVLKIGWANYIEHPEYIESDEDDLTLVQTNLGVEIDEFLVGALAVEPERRQTASELLLSDFLLVTC